MDNRQSSATPGVSNRPLLYPMPNNTAYSVHEQFRLILPPIKDLHLPMTKAVDAQTQTQTVLSQAIHSDNPTSLPPYTATIHRSNKHYTLDQIRFIQCKRDDENMPWMRVAEEYNRAFPGYYRSQAGLEGRYYREQSSEPRGNTGSSSRT
ncbi:hypothetical protein V493_00894 [Pseudogymnoascus sp. VKM F-4281 (FW-2241)]|nr:hypothetical protein V493_00894 [Pseudogymnoascus sp. VKM F-4281 (FW-2241)]